ncbi:DMT family transporter [Paracoccus sp. p4-l81]|uniref:DMT family transporter n=1 Tax=unclassified Paracoccus (in: a-proteobacteria) TaxID=2688777 RepID=UPI0035B9A187
MNPTLGIGLKIVSVILFTIMAALIKDVSARVPSGQVVFFRSAFAIPVILIWIAARGELATGLRTTNTMSHVWRGLVGTAAMGLSFLGVGLLPLPESTAIGFAMPLLTVIFAAMFLGEEVRAFRLSMVALGLAGVLIVLAPRMGGSGDMSAQQTLGAIATLAGAAFAALAQIFISRMVHTERTSAIVFWFSVTASVLSLASVPFGWVLPGAVDAAVLIGIGLIGGVAQIFLTSSYRFADASVVAPFDYLSMVGALAIGYWVFGDIPSLTMLTGAGLVILAGIMIIWRERQLGLERARRRKAMTPQG